MKRIFIFLSCLFFTAFAFAQNEVRIPGSQTKTFTSSIVSGQEYALQISLPASYGKSNKKYPVVYLMDSQWDFPLLTALYGQQYYDGFVPEVIIVGITWGGIRPNPDSLRVRDYTPTRDRTSPQSGGANKFLSVIKDEVFPLIQKNYRVDTSDRTLVGCSLGGLFTMYTLFTHPEMFIRYVAASPAFTWDNKILYKYEEQYHTNKSNPPARLFMCVGGVETSVPDYKKLTSFLENRHYSNLQIESKVLDNTGHSGTKGIGYEKGLQFVFERPSLQLSASTLLPYTGVYETNDGRRITIKSENNSLVATVPGANFNLLASSTTDFYTKAFFLKIHFEKDAAGKVSGFLLEQYGSNQFVKKNQ